MKKIMKEKNHVVPYWKIKKRKLLTELSLFYLELEIIGINR